MKVFIILAFMAITISVVCSMTMGDLPEWYLFKVCTNNLSKYRRNIDKFILNLFYLKTRFNKVYKNYEEEVFRQNLYLRNMIKIEEHNKLYKKGKVTYKLGMNQFGDLVYII